MSDGIGGSDNVRVELLRPGLFKAIELLMAAERYNAAHDLFEAIKEAGIDMEGKKVK